MTGDTIKLASEFPLADDAAWRSLAGNVPASFTDEGLEIQALQTGREDAAAIPGMRSGRWDIRQAVLHPDTKEANAEMLADLAGGAASVAIYFNHGSAPSGVAIHTLDDLAMALDGVLLDVAGVSLIAGPHAVSAAAAMAALWRRRDIADDRALAQFNIDPVGHMAATGGSPDSLGAAFDAMVDVAKTSAERWPGVRSVAVTTHAYHSAGCGEVQELAVALATGVQYLRALEARGMAVADAAGEMVFRVTTDADIFLSIAKLRALRQLWTSVLEASGVSGVAMPIEATAAPRMYVAPSPALNILRGTAACMAAVMGGADTVTILPHTLLLGLPDRSARRIARNVQIILDNETALARVADPAAGSYSIEALTGQLAGAAWEMFQGIEADGGMITTLGSGRIQDEIATVAAKRQAALDAGERVIVGVNGYADPDEDEVTVATPDLGTRAKARENEPVSVSTFQQAIEALEDGAPLAALSFPTDSSGGSRIEPLNSGVSND